MYFTEYHIFTIFASLTIFAFLQFLIIYYKRNNANKLYVYSLTLFITTSILSYSILMILDAELKKVELRNTNHFKSGQNVVYYGTIYNIGKAPVQTCTLTARIISVGANKKVDGSIFDTSRKFDPDILKRPKYSYSYDYLIKDIINEGATKNFRVNIPFPSHFKDYKIISMINCKWLLQKSTKNHWNLFPYFLIDIFLII